MVLVLHELMCVCVQNHVPNKINLRVDIIVATSNQESGAFLRNLCPLLGKSNFFKIRVTDSPINTQKFLKNIWVNYKNYFGLMSSIFPTLRSQFWKTKEIWNFRVEIFSWRQVSLFVIEKIKDGNKRCPGGLEWHRFRAENIFIYAFSRRRNFQKT